LEAKLEQVEEMMSLKFNRELEVPALLHTTLRLLFAKILFPQAHHALALELKIGPIEEVFRI